MEYIIDPKWFYWANVAEGATKVCSIMLVICATYCIGVILYRFLMGTVPKSIRVSAIASASLSVVFAIGLIFIPDRNTLIMMKTAELTTYSNIETVGAQIKDVIDYIVETLSNL